MTCAATRSLRSALHILRCAALIAATVAFVGCDEPTEREPAADAEACSPVDHDGERYCVGRYWITETGFMCAPGEVGCTAITETGFSCPDAAPNMVRQGGHFVCAPADSDMTPEQRNDIVTSADPAGDCITAREPAVDHDHDLLSSAVEDVDRDCIHDSGETDWLDIDTDGDLLSDGHEDHNHNGIFEPWRGETSPLLVDSDGDGTADTFEWGAAWCHPYQLEQPGLRPWGQLLGRVSVALTHGQVIARHTSGRGGVFADPGRGIFGFVVEPIDGSGGLHERLAKRLTTTAGLGHVPVKQHIAAPFDAFAITRMDGSVLLPPRPSLSARTRLSYGVDTPNSGLSAADPAAVRDQIFGALLGDPAFDAGFAATTCDEIEVAWIETEHPDDREAITGAVFACTDALDDDVVDGVFADLESATLFAPTSSGQVFDVLGMRCESQTVPDVVGQLDVLWVIDNSHSMHGEQVAVSASADQFLDTLDAADVDWRIGVTTTDAWARDRDDLYRVADDPWLDPTTGLRGTGFLSGADARTHFPALVTEWPGCQRDPTDPVGHNICGLGFESGLASGDLVLDAATADPRAAFRLRDDAVPLIVWVSDEEDLAFKDDVLDAPWAASDPRRAHATRLYVDEYSDHDAIGCAIVGDADALLTGACTPDPGDPDAIAAEHGLGYIDAAAALGGVSGSLCQRDFTDTIAACLQRAVARTASHPLQKTPMPANMRVLIDGTEVPRSATSGWSYDPVANALIFADTPLAAGAEIQTVFNTWAPMPR